MLKSLIKKHPISTYIGVLLGTSYIVELVIIYLGGIESEAVGFLPIVLMFFPTIFALLFLKLSDESWGFIDWRIKLKKIHYLFYASLIPSGLALLSVILISNIGLGSPTYFSFAEDGVIIQKGPFILGDGQQSIFFFLFNYLLTTLVYSAFNGLATMGEEIGWRGYLQKKLVSEYGILKGVGILGLVWGFWHFPIILNGYNYPNTPVLGAFILFPLTAIFASYFMAWLTINAKSVWPAVLAHGSVNTFFGYIVSGMDFVGDSLPADILVLGIWFVTAVLSYLYISKKYVTTDE